MLKSSRRRSKSLTLPHDSHTQQVTLTLCNLFPSIKQGQRRDNPAVGALLPHNLYIPEYVRPSFSKRLVRNA